MAQPTPYSRQYNFTNFQTVSPSSPLPADYVDLELNSVKATLDATLNNLKLIQRDDTALANGSVGYDQLKAELNGFGFNPPSTWATAVQYQVRDTVFENNGFYRCLVSHVSGTFSADLAAGDWELVADFASIQTAAAASAAAASSSATSASGSASTATSKATAAAASATTATNEATAAHTDRLAADADVVSTHADVVSTHADAAQTASDRTASNASATSAANSATAAAASAASTTPVQDQINAAPVATFADADKLVARRATDGVAIANTWSAIKGWLASLFLPLTGGNLTGPLAVSAGSSDDATSIGLSVDLEEGGSVFQATRYAESGNAPVFMGRKARGSRATPAAVQAGDTLIGFRGYGHDGSGFVSGGAGVAFLLEAAEDWAHGTNLGTQIRLFTTQNGSTANVERLKIANDGSIVVQGGAMALVDASGNVGSAGEFRSTAQNTYRHVVGNYGAFWRSDGSNLYLMLTASGDQYGSYNSLRPITVNLPLGAVTIGNGLSVSNGLNVASGNLTEAGARVYSPNNPPPSSIIASQTFTASGTWTKPAGLTDDMSVLVEMWDGGQAGNFTATNQPGGRGGNYIAHVFRAVDLPSSLSVTVGAGGATSAALGGLSAFGTYLTTSMYPGAQYPIYQGAAGAVSSPAVQAVFGGGGGGNSVASQSHSTFGGDGGPTNTNGSIPGGGGGAGSGHGARGEVRISYL